MLSPSSVVCKLSSVLTKNTGIDALESPSNSLSNEPTHVFFVNVEPLQQISSVCIVVVVVVDDDVHDNDVVMVAVSVVAVADAGCYCCCGRCCCCCCCCCYIVRRG